MGLALLGNLLTTSIPAFGPGLSAVWHEGPWAGRLESCFITLCHINSDLWRLMEDTLFLQFTEEMGNLKLFAIQSSHCALEDRMTFLSGEIRLLALSDCFSCKWCHLFQRCTGKAMCWVVQMRIVDYFGQLHSEEILFIWLWNANKISEALTQLIGSRAASAGCHGYCSL